VGRSGLKMELGLMILQLPSHSSRREGKFGMELECSILNLSKVIIIIRIASYSPLITQSNYLNK